MLITTSLIVGAVLSTEVFAAPSPAPRTATYATHRLRAVAEGVEINSFHPANTFETWADGAPTLAGRDVSGSTQEVAEQFIQAHLGISSSAFTIGKSFDGDVSGHAFFKQKFNGITVANAVANVVLNKQQKVTAFGNNFVKPSKVASPTPKISVQDAIKSAETTLSATFNGQPATIEYFATESGPLVLTHVVQVENNNHFFEAFVDASTGKVVSVNDFMAQDSFNVVPFFDQDVTVEGLVLETNPENPNSSPNGWVIGGVTAGNNAISFKGAQTATANQTDDGVFDYTLDPTLDPTEANNLAQAIVNAFYDVNTVHDITYQYGFTETSFNFQNDNFGLGGAGNDRVTISVQDAAGINNADFSTPADGQSGRMRMFLWNFSTPDRDGARESDIVFHEATHGTSNRLTGGGTGRCLQTREAGGMGEGWSDTFADWSEQNSAPVQDFVLGVYVTLKPGGIRTMPYSTSPTVNNLTYADLQVRTEVHSIGEIWANMLHNVHAALVDAHGFALEAKMDATRTEGNAVFMHLFIDQLATQPCNPTFLDARDAWIQSDVTRFQGANRCILWTAFASRGLGVNAANHVNDFTVPDDCVPPST